MSRLRTHKQRRVVLAGSVAGVCVVALLAGVIWQLVRSPSPVPAAVVRQAGFPLYIAEHAAGYTIVPGSLKLDTADPDTPLFSYKAASTNGQTITLTEQAYPQVIKPDQFFAGLGEYDQTTSKYGTVVLARPKGKVQTAIITPNNTTMIFATPSAPLPTYAWVPFFDALYIAN